MVHCILFAPLWVPSDVWVMQCIINFHHSYELGLPWQLEWICDHSINDISIYFKSIIEHAQHLEHYVLQKIKDKFYVNHAKSEFAKLKMDFLGHVTLF